MNAYPNGIRFRQASVRDVQLVRVTDPKNDSNYVASMVEGICSGKGRARMQADKLASPNGDMRGKA